MCAGDAGGSSRTIVGTADEDCGTTSTAMFVQHAGEQHGRGRVEREEDEEAFSS